MKVVTQIEYTFPFLSFELLKFELITFLLGLGPKGPIFQRAKFANFFAKFELTETCTCIFFCL